MKKIDLNPLNLLSQLVAFPSLTPHSAGSLEYIAQIVEQLGGNCHWLGRNQTSNLIATLGQGAVSCAFAGHVDVVPPGDSDLWHNGDPFRLQQLGNQLIGRGVADMKGAIAAFLHALGNFMATHHPSQYKIVLVLTSDEEGSAVDGTTLMVDYLRAQDQRFNYCLIGEPSSTKHLGDAIKIGRRGSLTGDLVIWGKQGHIAYPQLCINPIHTFAPALAELSTHTWDQGSDYFPATSLQFANLNSGLGVTNVIPGRLTANFNFRYNNLHTASSLQRQLTAILVRHGLAYEISWHNSAQPFLSPVGNLVAVAQQAISEVCGVTPQLKTDGGTSDGRFLIAVCDEMIELGLCNESIHQLNEKTSITDLEQLSRVYLKILEALF